MEERLKVVFVCLGNICRSPLAEGLFKAHTSAVNLSHRFVIDSAGTSAYHVGEPPDPGSVKVARKHGIDISDQRSRQLTKADLKTFDYIVAMDASNRRNIIQLGGGDVEALQGRLWMMRNFEFTDDGTGDDTGVPDPWGGGAGGFDEVYQIVDRACANFLRFLHQHHPL